MFRAAAVSSALGCAAVCVALAASTACTNNPYPSDDSHKKILYTSFDEAPKTLDPAVAYTTTEHEITGNVFDTLLEYHYLKRPYELIPGLATGVPKAEALAGTKVRYSFELKPDLLFQDDACFERGAPGRKTRQVVASDFVFELERIGDPAVNSPVTEPFSNVDGFTDFSEKLEGLRKKDKAFAKLPIREQYAKAGGISGLRAADDLHLEVTLAKAYPQILYWFAMPFTAPLPWEAVEYYDGQEGRDHVSDHPVGSGPYVLSVYNKEARIVLEKNPNWYGVRHPEWNAPGAVYPSEGEPKDVGGAALSPRAMGKALPFIERCEFRRDKEAIPTFNKFLQGYYDASGIIKESFDKVVRNDELSPEMKALGLRLDKSVEAATYYLGFNMQDPLVGAPGAVKAKKLRQAMSLAVNVDEYLRLFANGRGVPAQTPLPPGLFGYEESYQNPYRKVDIERGKKLLKEAGYEGGIDPKTQRPLHITYDVGNTSADAMLAYQFMVNEWRRLGLDVEVAATSYNKFQEKMRDGAYQIFQWGWVADYPDPENFFFLLWSDMARSKNNGPNTANFQNAEFDKLFLEMKARDNDAERLKLIHQMRAILEDQRPWIELYHRESYALYHSWVYNVKTAGLSLQTLKYRDIDPEQRTEKRREWNKPVMWPAYLLALMAVAIVVPGMRTFFRERQ